MKKQTNNAVSLLEEGDKVILDFCKLRYYFNRGEDIMPVVVQDAATKKVLMLAYANREAVSITLKTGLATFWSRSRKKIWVKGGVSGNLLKVMSVLADCDNDALLYIVKLPKGGGA